MSRELRARSAVAALVASVALLTAAGCGGSTGVVCSTIALAPPQLLYPQPGAIGVSPEVGLVILAPNGLALTDFSLTLQPAAGAPVLLSTPYAWPSTAPLPIGAASPFPGASLATASVPTLLPSIGYTLHLTQINPPTGPCAYDRSGDIGTFSTGTGPPP